MTKLGDSSDGPAKPAHGTQYFATFCASLGAFSLGVVLGYASPASFQLRGMNDHSSAYESQYRPFSNESLPFYNQSLSFYNASSAFTNHSSLLTYDPHHHADTLSTVDSSEHVVFTIPHDEPRDDFSSPQENESGGIFDETLRLNSFEISWFSSAFSIGALIGGVISSFMIQHLGRKGTMLASGVPSVLGWLLLGLGSNFLMLVFGRLFTGIFCGIISVVFNIYVAEIASSDIRGRLGSSFQLMIASGVVYVYFIGSYLMWYHLALVSLVPAVLFVFLMFFNKESPAHWIAKGRDEEAKEVLQYFRGRHYDITAEFSEMKQLHIETSQKKLTMSDFLEPTVLKPILIVLPLVAFMQLSGICAIDFNMATIFKQTNNGMSAYTSSLVVAVWQIFAAVPSMILMDTAGRKVMLIVSGIFMAIAMGILGLFFYLQRSSPEWTVNNLSWVPLPAVLLYFLAFLLGFGPIPYIVMGEMFPPHVRGTVSGLVMAVNWSFSFLVVYCFEWLQAVLHSYGLYWLFAGFSITATLFTIFFVKETKGKTLPEITAMFAKSKIQA